MITLGGDKFIFDILEEHFETVQVLWSQRLESPRSAVMSPPRLKDLDERIAAHTDALVLAGEVAFPLLVEGLQAEDASAALAAACPLLLMNTDTARQLVWNHFTQAEGPALEGIGLALCYAGGPALRQSLKEICEAETMPQAAVAAEVLAYNRWLPSDDRRLLAWLESDDPDIRRRAWRIVALIGSKGNSV